MQVGEKQLNQYMTMRQKAACSARWAGCSCKVKAGLHLPKK